MGKATDVFLTAQYMVYDAYTQSRIIIQESGDSPNLTELVFSDEVGCSKELRCPIRNENLPALIEALQRRLHDVRNDPEANRLLVEAKALTDSVKR